MMRFWMIVSIVALLGSELFAGMRPKLVVLPADPTVGRTAPVVARALRIRFHSGVLPSLDPQAVIQLIPEIQEAKSVLLPQQTVLYNPKERQRLGIQVNSDRYRQIVVLEEQLVRSFTVWYAEDEVPEVMAQRLLEKYPILEVATPFFAAQPLGPPNDPYYPQQEMLQVIRAEEAWEQFPGDTSVVIGIADSGVFQEHEDLEPSLWINRGEIPNNYIDDDGNGYVDDWRGCNFTWQDDGSDPNRTFGNGHGTAVSGIAGATVNNGKGIAGVANQCRIFPMKTMPGGSNFIIYGYDAILYSAMMGFAVVNCSWGSSAASVIEESIVNYATARGTAVVAGAGNHGSDDPFYPAAFPAVLGVGVCTVNDGVTNASAYGPHVPIFTPAQGAWTTRNDGGYGTFGATSGATPVASAAVALARAKNPALTAEQALTFVRQCVVDITDKNTRIAPYVARRLDLYQVVTRDPFAAPGLRYLTHSFQSPNGTEPRQFAIGDTMVLTVVMRNDLGPSNWLLATLELFQNTESLKLLQKEDSALVVRTGDTLRFHFPMILQNTQGQPVIFRLVFEDDAGTYRDYHFLKFTPTTAPLRAYTTFSNAVVRFSMADRGTIGFASLSPSRRIGGIGFQIAPWGNILFEAGIFATSQGKVVSSVRGIRSSLDDDFRPLKGFVPPDDHTSIIEDDRAATPIGIQVTQTVVLPARTGIAALRVTVKNVSGQTLPHLAVGYFFDWDIGPFGDANRITLRNDLLRTFQVPGALGIAVREGDFPVAVTGILIVNGQGRPQFAGFNNNQNAIGTPFGTYDGFTNAEKIRALTSDTTLQYSGAGDIACVVGVYFDTPIADGEERHFVLLFGAVPTETEVAAHLQRTLAALNLSAVHIARSTAPALKLRVVDERLWIKPAMEAPATAEIGIYSLDGRLLFRRLVRFVPHRWTTLPIGTLPFGQYIVNLRFAETAMWGLFRKE